MQQNCSRNAPYKTTANKIIYLMRKYKAGIWYMTLANASLIDYLAKSKVKGKNNSSTFLRAKWMHFGQGDRFHIKKKCQ